VAKERRQQPGLYLFRKSPLGLSRVGDAASAVENAWAAYYGTIAAPHECFDQTGSWWTSCHSRSLRIYCWGWRVLSFSLGGEVYWYCKNCHAVFALSRLNEYLNCSCCGHPPKFAILTDEQVLEIERSIDEDWGWLFVEEEE
jgi:hypothetical protein